MPIPVELPKLGNTVEECIIAKWRKQKGDKVSAGEVVADIETDKATFEVPAPADGTLLETFFDEGALVPVFTNLFVIGEAGESVEQFRPQSSGSVSPAAAALPEEQPAVHTQHAPAEVAGIAAMSPRARRFAEEHGVSAQNIAGSGPGGRVLEEDVRKAYYFPERVSRAARQHGQSAGPVSTLRTGPAAKTSAHELAVSSAGAAPAPVSTIRGKIARRMRESLASTAQYTLHASAEAGGLLTLRARIKASQGVPDININDLVAFCTIQALLEMPDLNAEFIDGRIQRHSAVHLGFAVDTQRGLMVPVVRDAHSLTAADLAQRMKELTAKTVQGSISPDQLSGATFTVSNLGGLGIESFTPLLNPPQVAILGIGAIQLKPVRKQGRVEFIDSIGLSLTCDHQVIDGAPGARFLQVLRNKIENVEALCTI
jgi:pyruvate dehydrogenase E2 component (dihydrolipoamide acetyltransferase)